MSEHNEYACAQEGCGAIICLSPLVEERLRETHESFVCTFGHSQSFNDKTAQEKDLERLRRLMQQKDYLLNIRAERIERMEHELRSLRSRLGAKTRKLQSVA
jgi:hypothetical protein